MDNKELDKSRAEFEAWAASQNWVIDRDSFGDYEYSTARDGWEAWRAALARAGIAAPAAPTLPNGWTVERVDDAMHIKRADGKWCGYMVENGPAAALTFDFLRDLAAPAAAVQPSEQDAKLRKQVVEALTDAKTLLELNGVTLDDDCDYGNGRADYIIERMNKAVAALAAATPEQKEQQ